MVPALSFLCFAGFVYLLFKYFQFTSVNIDASTTFGSVPVRRILNFASLLKVIVCLWPLFLLSAGKKLEHHLWATSLALGLMFDPIAFTPGKPSDRDVHDFGKFAAHWTGAKLNSWMVTSFIGFIVWLLSLLPFVPSPTAQEAWLQSWLALSGDVLPVETRLGFPFWMFLLCLLLLLRCLALYSGTRKPNLLIAAVSGFVTLAYVYNLTLRTPKLVENLGYSVGGFLVAGLWGFFADYIFARLERASSRNGPALVAVLR